MSYYDNSRFVHGNLVMQGGKEVKLRRFAFQIAEQLPENKADALLVLSYVGQLVAWENGSLAEIVEKAVNLVG